jgi:hypothetical protein
MAKRTDYSKVSLKSKPKSIRYNIKDFEAACGLCGRSTVQGLWDYLMAKYLSDMGVRQIAPIGKIDTRPVDERVFDVSKERVVVDEMSLYKKDVSHYMPRFENLPAPKVNFDHSKDIKFYVPKGEGSEPNPNAKVKINRIESNDEIEEMIKSVMKTRETNPPKKGEKPKVASGGYNRRASKLGF